MSDPVAEKSTFLRMYMSSHPDTLIAYAKWYGKVSETIKSAEMAAIDTKSMTLTCTLTDGSKKDVQVVLEPPLSGYDDVKPRLLEMKSLAQEGLGMIKTPKLKGFTLIPRVFTSLFIVLPVAYLAWSPKHSTVPFFAPANYVQNLVPHLFEVIAGTLVVVHILETMYVFTLCRKHTGFLVGAAYTSLTFILGISLIQHLRQRIQKARIDSVMKIE
ncbi:hypothetical protein C8J56DRAFT_865601 [Mycena floridula]|nr:hypothetical protein C8J56DRAFT_865601 [Mycena floridula]